MKDNSKELKQIKKKENIDKAKEVGVIVPTDKEIAEITGEKPKENFKVSEAGKGKYIVVNVKTKTVVREYEKKDGCKDPKKSAEMYATKLSK